MESEKLSFSCPACQSVLHVAAELAGVRGPCPNCQTEIVAPLPAYSSAISNPVALQSSLDPIDLGEVEPPTSRLTPLADQLAQSQTLAPTPGSGSPNESPDSESILWPPQPRPANSPTPETPEEAFPADLPSLDEVLEAASSQPLPSETISGDTRPDLEATDSADAASVIEISDQIEIPDVRVATPRAVALPRPAAPDGLESTPRGWRGTLSRIPLSHPALMKYGAPSLLLAMIGVGAIKFWPSGATELPGATPPTTSLASLPTTDETASADFEFKGEPSTKAQPSTKPQPITPAPESQFRPSSILNPDSIGSFLSDATGADADVEPKAEPAAALGAEIQDKPEPDAPNSAADDARAALEQALAAESVTELAKLVLTPERVLPKMKLYYGGRSPALVGTSIIYETSMPLPDSEHLNHTFFVSTEQQPMRFPIAIEETPDGMKLDWESFIELHDDLLGKFIASPQSDERTFHLILERRHFFGSDVPELGSKDCFRISTPIPGSEAYAFVEKDTPTAAVCKPFEWDRLCFPIATLRWTTPPAGKPYLEITKIVQTSWRAGGDAGAPELQ